MQTWSIPPATAEKTVHLPRWTNLPNPTPLIDHSNLRAILHRFLLSIESPEKEEARDAAEPDWFSSDEFMMYHFKVRRCHFGRGHHDWTDCPYAHPGEKARRRDPRRHAYAGRPCPEFRRKGECPKGEACPLAHGVFESWLHPDRYRTQPCRGGAACQRRVCFFAHSPDELRIGAESPPLSPVSEVAAEMRRLRVSDQWERGIDREEMPDLEWVEELVE